MSKKYIIIEHKLYCDCLYEFSDWWESQKGCFVFIMNWESLANRVREDLCFMQHNFCDNFKHESELMIIDVFELVICENFHYYCTE